jgi:hypothetical protein
VQKPIRYYITKSGEEPTVRSVKVALNAPVADDRVEQEATALADATQKPEEPQPAAVKRLVNRAIRKN